MSPLLCSRNLEYKRKNFKIYFNKINNKVHYILKRNKTNTEFSFVFHGFEQSIYVK